MPASRAASTRPLSSVIPPKAPVKRHRLTLQDRLDVIKFCEEHPNLTGEEASAALKRRGYSTLSQSSIWRFQNTKDELRELAQNPNELRFKRVRQVEYPDVDQALQKWILQKQGGRVRLSGSVIRTKARRFGKLFGHPENFLSLSGGWLNSLKARMGLRQYRFHGEAASAPVGTLGAEIARIRPLISKRHPRDVFNFDESALFWLLVPDVGLATHHMAGVKGNKTRLSVGLCSNQDGSEKLLPLIIGHARRPRAFGKRDGRELGYDYWWNKKAWMTGSIWQGWLANLNAEMARQGRYILLLVDNAPSHIHDPSKYPHVQIEFFAPNLTAWIQPNDAGIIRCWKANYKRLFVQQAIERDDAGEEEIYKVNQLVAMSMIHDAWDQVTPQTIRNCWAHTKLSGPDPDPDPSLPAPSVPILPVDAQEPLLALQTSLDDLHQRTRVNPIEPASAAEFTELEGTVPTEQEWTDEEIVEQVRAEMQQAEADARGEALYDDDDDTESGEPGAAAATPAQSLASRDDALASLQVLQNYVSHLNDPRNSDVLSLLHNLSSEINSL